MKSGGARRHRWQRSYTPRHGSDARWPADARRTATGPGEVRLYRGDAFEQLIEAAQDGAA